MTAGTRTWVAGETLVCLDADAPEALASRIEALLAADVVAFDDLVPVLTDGDLARMPGFLLGLREDDGVRIVVRGPSRALVTCRDGGDRIVDGADARTWREELVQHATSVRLSLPVGELVWFTAGGVLTTARPTDTTPAAVDAGISDAAGRMDGDDLTLAQPDVLWSVDRAASERTPPQAGAGPVADEPSQGAAPQEPVAAPVAEEEFDFSNLLDETRFRDVESAAVRPMAVGEDGVAEAVEGAESVGDTGAQAIGEPEGASPVGSSAPKPPADAPPRRDAAPLISGVPGLGGVPAPEPVPAPASPSADDGDDDDAGHTISIGELRRKRAQAAGGAPETGKVQALRCPGGHDNPPTAVRCRVCDAEITDRSVHFVRRPLVARLRFSTGAVVDLDKGQLVGRKPTTDVGSGSEPPGLVTVPSPDGSISRVHVAVHVEGWDVLVEDQGSTNGTVVVLPDKEPERLREHDPRLVVPGTEVRIADTVTFSVEVPRP